MLYFNIEHPVSNCLIHVFRKRNVHKFYFAKNKVYIIIIIYHDNLQLFKFK